MGLLGLVFLPVLALLIGDTAAGLAGRLAGRLAFSATAVLCAFAQITGVQCLNMLHLDYPPGSDFRLYSTIALFLSQLQLSPFAEMSPLRWLLFTGRANQK